MSHGYLGSVPSASAAASSVGGALADMTPMCGAKRSGSRAVRRMRRSPAPGNTVRNDTEQVIAGVSSAGKAAARGRELGLASHMGRQPWPAAHAPATGPALRSHPVPKPEAMGSAPGRRQRCAFGARLQVKPAQGGVPAFSD